MARCMYLLKLVTWSKVWNELLYLTIFPLYVIRYLEVNKEEVRQKRTDVALLKSRLSKLQASLHR